MKVPFSDLSRQYQLIEPGLQNRWDEIFHSAAFSNGPAVQQFEAEFAAYCHVDNAIAVNSGTSALQLALAALDVGTGDEVIIPTNSFISTAWAVSYLGAKPVFADCDDFHLLDPVFTERLINESTKVIIGVDLFGQPCDWHKLTALAKQYELHLVEDAAQAHGAQFDGMKTGVLGDISTFSFYPSKNLGAYGEGGMLTTSNDLWAMRLQRLRNHAAKDKYHYTEIGYNMRMDSLQAAVLSCKLPFLDAWNLDRVSIAGKYNQGLDHPLVKLPVRGEHRTHVYHLYVIQVADRLPFLKHLEHHNVGYGLHYPIPCHLQEAYRHLGYRKGDFPKAEALAEQCVSLPMFPEMTEEEVAYVIEVVNAYDPA